jgi:hypothetical protein
MYPEAKPENNLSDLPEYGSPAWHARNQAEIDGRPTVLPLDQRNYPSGKPDRAIQATAARLEQVRKTGCIGNLAHHGK